MTSRAVFLRNVVVVVGAYYTCGQVLAAFWILTLQLTGSVPIDPILPFATALLAGLICGNLLESSRQAAWSFAAGVFVACCTWSSMHWYVKPPLTEVLRYGARAMGAGVVTGLTCWIVWRRRNDRIALEPDASLSTVKRNFILQQGLPEPAPASCAVQYSGLLFQPRLVGVVLLVAVVLQDPRIFLALAAVLWWSALFPRWNPFEALYDRTLALRPGRVALAQAPSPRRFAQGMAGTFALAVGIALMLGWKAVALILQGLLVVAVGALVFGGFCLGSFVFHVLSGRKAFAKRTLPWARGT